MRKYEQQRENNATCEIPQCFVSDKDGAHGFTLKYSNIPHIKNSIFHLRPKSVSNNTRLSGNEGQCFLYEGCKLIAFHMS